MLTRRSGPLVVNISQKEGKKPRPGLAGWAFIISLLAFGFTLYTFYFKELRISDDLTATIISFGGNTDTNGFYTVEAGVVLRNEGNRQIVLPSVALELSETAAFDLVVRHAWKQTSPVVVPPKQTIYEKVVFGSGYRKYQMIESRRADMPAEQATGVNTSPEEPTIFGRLAIDVVDSQGRLHEQILKIGTLQRSPGLIVDLALDLPHSEKLLPSKLRTLDGTLDLAYRTSYHWRPQSWTNELRVESTGPLGVRLPGIYTNAGDSGWPLQLPEEFVGYGLSGSVVAGGTGAVRAIRISQVLGNLQRGEMDRLVSKDGLHVASMIGIRTNGLCVVSLDGKDGPHFDGIGTKSLLFSENSQRFAYIGVRDGKYSVILDGKIGQQFEGIGSNTTQFSSNSVHFAYVGIRKGKNIVVLDGREGPELDGVGNLPVFTRDSSHLVYVGVKTNKQFVVWDNKPGPAFDGIGDNSLVFNSNNTHRAYVGIKKGKPFAVMDDKVGPEFDGVFVGSLTFTSDGEHLVYNVMKDGKQRVVMDGIVIALWEFRDGKVELKTVPNPLAKIQILNKKN